MESFYIFIWKSVQEKYVYKEPCVLKEKWKPKLTSEHLPCCTWNTVNTNWRVKYFLWYCLKKCEHNNFNNGTVNAVQKKFV